MAFESEMKNPEIEKREKPKVVYHSSHNPNIEKFIPRDERARDFEEGPVVFATPSKALASAFLIEDHNDEWTQIGYFDDVPVVVICSDREEFVKKDRGGTLYALPGDSFGFDPNQGMGELEWTSRSNIKPIEKNDYPSALDAMIENGVNVFFVDRNIFDEICNADDHGASLLLQLVSENQFRGQDIARLKEALIKEKEQLK